ncbi:MAG: adenylosuccinate synthase [Bacteroidetes bacterium]|nr:adenylosuccinate synthase [Bacteroidota bacterium]
MKADVLLGLQWGDEGKGKIVDFFTPHYDIIARFQGGPNAGHTLEFDGTRHVLHTIPSGVFHADKVNIIGNGVVIDPVVFKKEIDDLESRNAAGLGNILISKRAHLILPTHKLLDAASEKSKGEEKIGSTLRGIGPAYMDKTGRNGLRVGDISLPDFDKRFSDLVQKHSRLLEMYRYHAADMDVLVSEWKAGIECLKKFSHIDAEHYINASLAEGKTLLAEGAQGSLLDIDFGSYPFVTSSNTTCAGACTGLGIPPSRIGRVFGIMKAYCTRVGGGPFPTELAGDMGNELREAGKEYGATTGRPRRCGWLDIPALKYSIMLNGVTELIMTKADVLSSFDKVMACISYRDNSGAIMPVSFSNNNILPVYREFAAWKLTNEKMNFAGKLPPELSTYIRFIEEQVNVPVTIVSVGPERSQVIKLSKSAWV